MPPIAGNNHHCHRMAASPMVTREELLDKGNASPREIHVSVGGADRYAREIGCGRTIIVLHGGPDFDQSYLLPEMDRLADGFRLTYYEQRGRGKSAAGVQPDDITLACEIAETDRHVTTMDYLLSFLCACARITRKPESIAVIAGLPKITGSFSESCF